MARSPWTALFPLLFIVVTILVFNILGDALRDVLDGEGQGGLDGEGGHHVGGDVPHQDGPGPDPHALGVFDILQSREERDTS